MTAHELKRLYPNASDSFIRANTDSCSGPVAIVERSHGNAPSKPNKVKIQHHGRYFVCVTSIRNRLLDEDNLCEKMHVDILRYAGILPSDAPGATSIKVTQRKCDAGESEHTQIEVTYIP